MQDLLFEEGKEGGDRAKQLQSEDGKGVAALAEEIDNVEGQMTIFDMVVCLFL